MVDVRIWELEGSANSNNLNAQVNLRYLPKSKSSTKQQGPIVRTPKRKHTVALILTRL
jgi:hypothetical protein